MKQRTMWCVLEKCPHKGVYCPLKSIPHIVLIVPKLISDIIEKLYHVISVECILTINLQCGTISEVVSSSHTDIFTLIVTGLVSIV